MNASSYPLELVASNAGAIFAFYVLIIGGAIGIRTSKETAFNRLRFITGVMAIGIAATSAVAIIIGVRVHLHFLSTSLNGKLQLTSDQRTRELAEAARQAYERTLDKPEQIARINPLDSGNYISDDLLLNAEHLRDRIDTFIIMVSALVIYWFALRVISYLFDD